VNRAGIALLLLVVLACGDDDSVATTATTATTQAPATTGAAPTSTLASSVTPTVVFGIVSGRGDDQSFEVSAYFDAAPGATRIVIGIDSDDSYDGVGDPTPDLEGWAEFTTTVAVGANGELVAGGSSAGIGDWVSWGAEGNALRVFFIRDVSAVAGTLWVVVGDGSGPGSIAGVTAGESCSVRGSDLGITPGGDVPDPGVTCRYP